MNLTIILTTLGVIGAILIMWILDFKFQFPKMKDPGIRKNQRKEKKLLKVLMKDMKKNPGHWIQHGFSPQLLSSAPILVNDKKNMGILYGDKKESVSIHFNMKDVTKFDRQDTDAIVTSISGKHVKKFIKIATHLLDHRGKELEYFTERLKERL